MRVLLKGFEFLYSTLQTEINFIDFVHARSLFLVHNDKALKQKNVFNKRNSMTYSKIRNRSMILRKLFLIILAMFYQKPKNLFFGRV